MKKIILSLLLALVSVAAQAEDFEPLKNKFIQVGGLIGGEINEVQYIYGGGGLAGGFRFDEKMAILVKADAAFTRQFAQFNIIGIYLGPEFQYKFYKDIFGFVGAGYAVSIANQGTSPNGTSLTTKETFSSYYVEGGVGYEFQAQNQFSILPQAGFRYTKVGQLNFMVPYGRVDLRISF